MCIDKRRAKNAQRQKRYRDRQRKLRQEEATFEVYALSNSTYSIPYELTLTSSCLSKDKFMLAFKDMQRCLQRKYRATAVGLVEYATEDAMTLHSHFLIRFPLKLFDKLGNRKEEATSDYLRSKIIRDWQLRCQRRDVKGYDRSISSIMRVVQRQENFERYLLKTNKGGFYAKDFSFRIYRI